MKNNKDPGPGCIPPESIKAVAIENSKYVVRVYNKLAKDAIFPGDLKKANKYFYVKEINPLVEGTFEKLKITSEIPQGSI